VSDSKRSNDSNGDWILSRRTINLMMSRHNPITLHLFWRHRFTFDDVCVNLLIIIQLLSIGEKRRKGGGHFLFGEKIVCYLHINIWSTKGHPGMAEALLCTGKTRTLSWVAMQFCTHNWYLTFKKITRDVEKHLKCCTNNSYHWQYSI
jgi:hypothetical protein